MTHDDLRPVDGAGARLDDENVTFCSDGTVHPKHHDPDQIGKLPMLNSPSHPTVNTSPATGTAKTVYILYLASLVFAPLVLVGLIFATVNRDDGNQSVISTESWINTHFRFQIRTFWIGLLSLVISIAAMFFVIGFLMILVWILWWIVRAVKGLKFLSQGQPVPNPESGLW